MSVSTITEKITEQKIWPLSQPQLGIWLGQCLSANAALYNAAELIEIKGPLQLALFEQALQVVYGQAQTLHVLVVGEDEAPQQQTCQHDVKLQQLDFSNEVSPLKVAMKWAQQDLGKPIDLRADVPFRNALIRLADQHVIWYQCIHHLHCDGFAFALLSQQVAECYTTLVDMGREGINSVSLKPIQPRAGLTEVIEEDQHYQRSKSFTKSQQFWHDYLAQCSPPVRLSQGELRVHKPSLKISRVITAEQFSQLKNSAQQLGSSWPDYLYACVAAFMAEQTGAAQVSLGLPVMGRMGSVTLRVPTMVMNIVPLNIDIPYQASFEVLVREVSEQMALTRPHHKYRYEQLGRDMGVRASGRRLFGPIVNIMPFDRPLNFAGIAAQQHGLSAGPVEDMACSFVLCRDSQGQLSLRTDIEFNPNNYDQAIAQQWVDQLMGTLKTIIDQPKRPLQMCDQRLSWLEGESLPSAASTVLDLIAEQCRRRGDHYAVEHQGQRYSYSQLWQQSQKVANQLRAEGVCRGQFVVLKLPRGYAAIVTFLGVMRAGAAAVMLDYQGPEQRNRRIVEDLQPCLLITLAEECTNSFGIPMLAVDELLRQSQLYSQPQSQPQSQTPKHKNTAVVVGESDLAYAVYTSGSTGKPKGVLVSHRAQREFVEAAIATYPFSEQDRVLQFAPLHFDTFIEELFCTLCAGASLVIRAEDDIQSVPYFLQQCEANRISLLDLPTAYWHELVYACREEGLVLPPCVNKLIIGGEAASAERLRQWHELNHHGVELLNSYGPSEATVVASVAKLLPGDPLTIGKPLPNRILAVVNEHLQLLPRGEVGELVVARAGIADGYHRLESQTRSQFVSLPSWLIAAEQKAYRTGDKVRIDQQGRLHFIGRIDDEIKISGQRIQPLEVEHCLQALPAIAEAAVCVHRREDGQAALHAFVCSELSPEQIRLALAQQLPATMLPRVIHSLATLPRNRTGKIDRQQLLAGIDDQPALLIDTRLSNDQQQLALVWREVLGVEVSDPDADFFMLGGQSLQAIQLVSRLSKKLGRELSTTLLFNHPSLSGLAAKLAESDLVNTEKGEFNQAVTAAERAAMIIADSQLCQQNFPPVMREPVVVQPPRLILLTGATGFVGIQLLAQLYFATDANVVCLVRAATKLEAEHKINQALQQQALKLPAWQERVEIVLSDLSCERLGLSEKKFQSLAVRCDLIVHNAATVSVMQDYRSLRAVNLESTRQLLTLARQHLIPLHFVSTIATAMDPDQPQVSEDFVGWHAGLQDGYQQSKWAAEHLLQQASERGYPVTVYRLGRVTGDLASGYVNPQDLMWNIIRAAINVGATPELVFSEPWTPVDKVAAAMVANILNQSADGVCQLLPKQMTQCSDIFYWLREQLPTLQSLPMPEWLAKLSASQDQQDATLSGFFQQRKQSQMSRPQFERRKLPPVLTAIGRDDFLQYWRYWWQRNSQNSNPNPSPNPNNRADAKGTAETVLTRKEYAD